MIDDSFLAYLTEKAILQCDGCDDEITVNDKGEDKSFCNWYELHRCMIELHSSGTINGLPVVALTVADHSARTRLGIESQDRFNIGGKIYNVLSKATDMCLSCILI